MKLEAKKIPQESSFHLTQNLCKYTWTVEFSNVYSFAPPNTTHNKTRNVTLSTSTTQPETEPVVHDNCPLSQWRQHKRYSSIAHQPPWHQCQQNRSCGWNDYFDDDCPPEPFVFDGWTDWLDEVRAVRRFGGRLISSAAVAPPDAPSERLEP